MHGNSYSLLFSVGITCMPARVFVICSGWRNSGALVSINCATKGAKQTNIGGGILLC